MPLVMCRKDSPGPFKRSVRDANGKILKTLEFPPGESVDVSFDDLPAIKNDLFHALLPVKPLFFKQEEGDKSPPRPNGKLAIIEKEEFERLVSGDTELEAATAPAPAAVTEPPVPEEKSDGKKSAGRSAK